MGLMRNQRKIRKIKDLKQETLSISKAEEDFYQHWLSISFVNPSLFSIKIVEYV